MTSEEEGERAVESDLDIATASSEETRRFPADELRPIFELADVERTLPLRRFGEPTRAPTASGAPGASAPESQAGDGSAAGVVRNAVELGYRVIQEQIQLGRELAEQLGHGHYDRSPLFQAPFGDTTSQLLSLWLELVNTVASGLRGLGRPGATSPLQQPADLWPRATPGAVPHPAPATGSEGSRQGLVVDVESRRRLQIELELDETHDGRGLFARLLSVADPQSEALLDVVLEPSERGRPRLKLRVPDEVPSGTYTGVVIEQGTGRHLGALTVTLRD